MGRFLPLLLALALSVAAVPTACGASPSGRLSASVYDYAQDRPGPTQELLRVGLRLNGAPIAGEMPAIAVEGRTLAPLRLLAEALGAQVTWQPDAAAQVRLTRGETTIQLTLGSAVATVNGRTVALPDGVPAGVVTYQGQGYTMVPLRFFSETLGCRVGWDQGSHTALVFTPSYIEPLLAPLDTPSDPGRLIVIDAGHGGAATGAAYSGVQEKTLNLAIARKLQSILTALGYNTVMTRDADVDVGLYDRAAIANEAGADIFVSIHCNAAENSPNFQGLYVYHYPGSAAGESLAQAIQTPACAFTGAVDRDIDCANFVVLRESDMPAVLVETGFMTCAEELSRLTDDAYQTRVAQGLAQGIVRYFNAR